MSQNLFFWDSLGDKLSGYSVKIGRDASKKSLAVTFHLPQYFYDLFEGLELGSFREGLWQGDCLEVFVFGENGKYIEWNLGVSLDWWVCGFDSYRSPSPSFEPFKFKPTDLKVDPGVCSISFDLPATSAFENTKHVRACIIDKKIPEPHLLCSDKAAAVGRDFHMKMID